MRNHGIHKARLAGSFLILRFYFDSLNFLLLPVFSYYLIFMFLLHIIRSLAPHSYLNIRQQVDGLWALCTQRAGQKRVSPPGSRKGSKLVIMLWDPSVEEVPTPTLVPLAFPKEFVLFLQSRPLLSSIVDTQLTAWHFWTQLVGMCWKFSCYITRCLIFLPISRSWAPLLMSEASPRLCRTDRLCPLLQPSQPVHSLLSPPHCFINLSYILVFRKYLEIPCALMSCFHLG